MLGLPVPSQMDLHAAYLADSARFNLRALLLRYYAFQCGVAASVDGRNQYWPASADWPDADPEVKDFQVAHAWMLVYIGYLHLQQPYDLRASRCQALATFADVPLLEYDLSAPPLRDPSGLRGPVGLMSAWSIISGRPITALRSGNFPGPIASGDRSGSAGWNLTARFAPSERATERRPGAEANRAW